MDGLDKRFDAVKFTAKYIQIFLRQVEYERYFITETTK